MVTIGADRSDKDGRHWVSLTISDTGPGIDPAVLPHLFEPFVSTRLDSRGTGLGLAVAEGIVREHGGVILARNRTDRSGAIFEVLLPAAPASMLNTRTPASTSTP
jgi:signal transduction histidine kinase